MQQHRMGVGRQGPLDLWLTILEKYFTRNQSPSLEPRALASELRKTHECSADLSV